MSLLTTRNTYVYKNIRLYFYFRRWYCVEQKAIAENSRTRRSCQETDETVNNWLWAKFGNLHSLQLSRDLQQFLFFVNHGYAHISLLCFPLFYVVCFPLATCPSPVLWAYASATITEFNDAHCSGDFPISSTGCTCFQHNNCGHGDISAITVLILSFSGYNPINILWYIAPVDMMIFRWSHRSYQSICQQHPPYSHPQVTLIYYSFISQYLLVDFSH